MKRTFLSSKDFRITASPDPFGGAGMAAPGAGGSTNTFTNNTEPGPHLQRFECPECQLPFNEGRKLKEHLRDEHHVRDTVR